MFQYCAPNSPTCRSVGAGSTRDCEIVSQQPSVESTGYGKRHAGPEGLNSAQLPACDDAIALERQSVYGVQREIMANVVTASGLVGRTVVRIVPRRRSVIAAQTAICVGEVG